MPHPERACEVALGSADGRLVLESMVETYAARVAAADSGAARPRAG